MLAVAWWGKIIGGAIGLVGFGPLGALVGVAIGSGFDKAIKNSAEEMNPTERTQTAFFIATFSVMGYVAKADGRVSSEEISYAKHVMRHMSLNPEQRKTAIDLFNQGKELDFDLTGVLENFSKFCKRNRNIKRMFVSVQIEGAFADGHVQHDEYDTLQFIAEVLGFNQVEFTELFEAVASERVGASHQDSSSGATQRKFTATSDDYKMLGISKEASDVDVKRAYRRKISQFHPDKLVSKGLPDEMIDMATEKSKQIRAAYERIRDARKQADSVH